MVAQKFSADPPELEAYFKEHGIAQPSRADVVLALLRINTPDSLRAAEVLAGVAIERCPPWAPPWPPKPVQRRPQPRVVRMRTDNPHYPSSELHARFRLVRLGMTVEQMMARGITKRDIRQWIKLSALEIR